VHSTPGRPQGRGKIERFFRTVRQQFLVELAGDAAERVADLAELNRLLVAWVEADYHRPSCRLRPVGASRSRERGSRRSLRPTGLY
jgi:transposase InsO family protein